MRGFVSGIIIGLVAGVIITVKVPSTPTTGQPQPITKTQFLNTQQSLPIVWNLASVFTSDLMLNGGLGLEMINRLKKASNNNIVLRFHEPATLTPVFNVFNAVSSGTIDTAFSSSQFWGKKSPAFELFSSIPFGPNIPSYLTWFRKHGGQQLYEDLYRKYNIHSMICGVTGVAGAGWFNSPIEDLADFTKLKIAATGLTSRVYKHLGATTIRIAPSDLANAVKQKQVDAVSFSTPTVDKYLNITDLFTHYYFPGWFQQAGFLDLMISLKKWDTLSKNQQEMIETACMANIEFSLSASEGQHFGALKHFVKKGVHVKRFPPKIIKSLNLAWISVSNSLMSSNKDFRKVWKSMRKFRKNYLIWQDLGKI